MNPNNCLSIRAFAEKHACQELLNLADRYTQQHFLNVKESEEFLFLPVNQLIDILSNDELNIASEEDVFLCVMKWVSYDVEQRKQFLSKVN